MNVITSNQNKIKNKNTYQFFKTGRIFYVKYLLIKNDEIRISNFIGLCTAIKKKSNSVLIQNTVKREKIRFLFYINSPLIVSVLILKKYKKKYRLSKLYYK